MPKYVRVMDGLKSNAGGFEYKLNQVNVADKWNPSAEKGRDFGGFNYTTEENIVRWLHRGNTIYDVTVPSDAEIVKVKGATTIYRCNKIIVSNPRKIDDDMALHFYEISDIPEKSYYKALGAVSIMNYKKTAYAIIKDKINKDHIAEVLEEWDDFIENPNDANEFVKEVDELLHEIQSNLLISRFIDKEPYIKTITNDKVINLTGESGSGKSYYSKQHFSSDGYTVIDTDIVFSDKESSNKESMELRKIFADKNKNYIISNFDDFYLKTLEYFKDSNKTIVIDSAQFRNIKDYSILKGKLIVMRTCIETCYERTIDRFKDNNKEYTADEYQKFATRKKDMFKWYKSINEFLKNINNN